MLLFWVFLTLQDKCHINIFGPDAKTAKIRIAPPTEKGQKDKQWSTKHYTYNKRMSNTNPTNTEKERRCSGKVIFSCSTSGLQWREMKSVRNSGGNKISSLFFISLSPGSNMTKNQFTKARVSSALCIGGWFSFFSEMFENTEMVILQTKTLSLCFLGFIYLLSKTRRYQI